jgi:CRISPR system Cascade subunit CasA
MLAISGFLGGCAHYQAAPLDPGLTADEFAARTLIEPPLRDQVARLLPQAQAAWPPAAWDRAELLAVALMRNPQLAVARARVAAALSHELSAAELPNPDLILESEYARHDSHPWLYGVGLNWLLRGGERRRLDVDIARLDTANARLQLMDEAWGLRRALVAALSNWESARRQLRLIDRLAAAQDRLAAVERLRVEAGEDAPGDLIIARQARLQIEQDHAQLQQAVQSAQAAAAKALGLLPQALDGLAFTWPEWGEPPPLDETRGHAAREQALLSRADLGLAIGDYAQAEAKLHQSIARQYPEFTLSPGYYWDHGIAKFPFDVGFTLPLNRNRGEIAEARAGRDLAARHMLAIQAAIYGDIAAAERAEQLARASTDAAQRQWEAAQLQEQQADEGLQVGALGQQERIGAEIIAARAELALVQVRAELQNSRNDLEDALHAPLSGPELALGETAWSVASGAGS